MSAPIRHRAGQGAARREIKGVHGMQIGERGQAFEPFNMLLGAIIALTMLAIIISTVNYFEEKKFEVSRQKFNEGVANAVRQPNGSPLQIKSIFLKQGTIISTKEMSTLAGIGEECFDIAPITGTAMSRLKEGVYEAKQSIITTLVITCKTDYSNSCEIGCGLGFIEET